MPDRRRGGRALDRQAVAADAAAHALAAHLVARTIRAAGRPPRWHRGERLAHAPRPQLLHGERRAATARRRGQEQPAIAGAARRRAARLGARVRPAVPQPDAAHARRLAEPRAEIHATPGRGARSTLPRSRTHQPAGVTHATSALAAALGASVRDRRARPRCHRPHAT